MVVCTEADTECKKSWETEKGQSGGAEEPAASAEAPEASAAPVEEAPEASAASSGGMSATPTPSGSASEGEAGKDEECPCEGAFSPSYPILNVTTNNVW